MSEFTFIFPCFIAVSHFTRHPESGEPQLNEWLTFAAPKDECGVQNVAVFTDYDLAARFCEGFRLAACRPFKFDYARQFVEFLEWAQSDYRILAIDLGYDRPTATHLSLQTVLMSLRGAIDQG